MSYAARVDATHAAVVAAIRATGLHVRDLSRVGGVADLLVTNPHTGMAIEVEVKDGRKPASARRLTKAQAARFGTPFWVVGCVRCAMKVAFLLRVNTPTRDNCCGVGGPVPGRHYWSETKARK